ncbi:hypothetical protein G6F60_007757 [Rhizopus arrhizus]|uniref:BHLH domain-containing protein n=1 Tax=Rhizopus oryzae TaxID=64495 RepID=A0A9P7BR16_RHIOR|nr:hypothetical protein G6F24_007752 [Rhizopus arrhizus]KAG0908612.1 hypothetical protein G6F33_009537 [Rhizopus arrhizus]KAG0942742.1 hypothetical protein G6F32_007939 [Rhizopus arrhizus]KAG1291766.1 hypothetical protein G6F66_007549 [Rhizopus arrhizus]KAG1306016.1 hypothetical protein G6F64_007920 [Rhizopus arrhizus]
METFAPFPVDFLADNNNNNTALNEEDPYFSLSQFDFELQQQAQAALQQQESWQDFDKYLSLDTDNSNQLLMNQPMLMNTTFNDPSLLYAPLNEIIPTQQNYLKKSTVDNHVVKQEYETPESLPYSPPVVQQDNLPNDDPNAASTTSNQSPKLTNTTTPSMNTSSTPIVTPPNDSIDFLNWTNLEQGKVPIQRLKQINSVNTVNHNNLFHPSSSPSTGSGGRQQKKTAHNAIERRYRNNINDRIAELKNAVPALLYAKVKDTSRKRKNDEEDDGEDGEEYLDGVAVATKLNKATILRKATEYINHLKKTGEDVKQENEILQRILSQLPGGPDILQRYHLQKKQREKELHRQQLLEREFQKQQEQQRKAANRKRARYNRTHPEGMDEYESSSSSPDPLTPPAVTSRVFMAMFMAITFFSTSPLTTGPKNTSDHHPVSRTQDALNHKQNLSSPSAPSFLASLFQFDSTWTAIRTCLFIVFILQLVYPLLRSYLFDTSFKLKRVNRARRFSSHPVSRQETRHMTPGDLKCRQMYAILNRSDRLLPHNALSTLLCLLKEMVRLFSHHSMGYDVLYQDLSTEEEWTQAFRWIKLNETLCLGRYVSRLTMIYASLRMINLVDLLDEEDAQVYQIHARAYATAAIQMAVAVPQRGLADKISNYFWRLAMHHIEKEENEEEEWMLSLTWLQPHQPTDVLKHMPQTRAWSETIEILQNQTGLSPKGHGLSISYSAPVTVPVAILSTLHLLDCLHVQFQQLIAIMASRGPREEDEEDEESLRETEDDLEETEFVNLMHLTEPRQTTDPDQQRSAYWLAVVGAVLEGVWKDKTDEIEHGLAALIRRVPRSMTSSLAQKSEANRLDELIKKSMIHTLLGSVLLKSQEIEKRNQGLAELKNAESIRPELVRLQSKLHVSEKRHDLESTVLSLADFAVSFVGIESWLIAMELKDQDVAEIEDVVKESALSLRRMLRHPYLKAMRESKDILERLTELCNFIDHQHPADTDSGCDLVEDHHSIDSHELLVKRAKKAQSILHGSF